MALAKVMYLKSRDDLDLQLEQCDATNIDEMSSLLHSLQVPVAGCFHMTLVLSDAPFFKQTHETFHDVYDSKLKGIEAFSAQVSIESLDFFVALSSISGLVGLMGQSNYARFVILVLADEIIRSYFSALARHWMVFLLVTTTHFP
jgi:hypothetical protein